jgi:DNA-binding transcriptional LysR family regulator
MASLFPIPLNAIRAIEIVARRGALAPAAEELGVTPGAVSQHLRRAEERLGLELFERTPQGLRPTDALGQILPQLSAGFSTLADAVGALARTDDHVLTITTGSVFASRWLIWRIGKFTALHPEIETRLVVTGKLADLTHRDMDCAIRYGRGDWPETNAELLGGQHYAPVMAPTLTSGLRVPADIARLPIIRDTTTMLSWEHWFAGMGVSPMPDTYGPTFSDPALAFDAAISEQGVLMAADQMSADAVSDGRLARPFPSVMEERLGYWFVATSTRREPRRVRLFREWMRSEMPDSVKGYVDQAKRGHGVPAARMVE